MMSRRGVGTSVLSGMVSAAVLGIFLIPVLYVIVQWLREKVKRTPPTAAEPAGAVTQP
jgi:hypothetical protein